MRLIRLIDGSSVGILSCNTKQDAIDVTSWRSPFREFELGWGNRYKFELLCDSYMTCLPGTHVISMSESTWVDFVPISMETWQIGDGKFRIDIEANQVTWHTPPGPSVRKKKPKITGAGLIRSERNRQIRMEGYTPDRDAGYVNSELIEAASCYLNIAWMISSWDDPIPLPVEMLEKLGVTDWPWSMRTFKPSADRERNLVKAGALIAAEVDRLRAAKKVRP